MAVGDNAYIGLGVPLNGNFEIIGDSTSLDIMTITHKGSATGDYLVMRTSATTEYLSVTNNGGLVLSGGEGVTVASTLTLTAGDAEAKFFRWNSTAGGSSVLTTGMTAGDIFLLTASNIVRMGYASASNNYRSFNFTNN